VIDEYFTTCPDLAGQVVVKMTINLPQLLIHHQRKNIFCFYMLVHQKAVDQLYSYSLITKCNMIKMKKLTQAITIIFILLGTFSCEKSDPEFYGECRSIYGKWEMISSYKFWADFNQMEITTRRTYSLFKNDTIVRSGRFTILKQEYPNIIIEDFNFYPKQVIHLKNDTLSIGGYGADFGGCTFIRIKD